MRRIKLRRRIRMSSQAMGRREERKVFSLSSLISSEDLEAA